MNKRSATWSLVCTIVLILAPSASANDGEPFVFSAEQAKAQLEAQNAALRVAGEVLIDAIESPLVHRAEVSARLEVCGLGALAIETSPTFDEVARGFAISYARLDAARRVEGPADQHDVLNAIAAFRALLLGYSRGIAETLRSLPEKAAGSVAVRESLTPGCAAVVRDANALAQARRSSATVNSPGN